MSWQNPFEFSACIPDGSNGTGCFSLKQDIVLSTGVAGTCCGIIAAPLPAALYYNDSSSVNATATIAGNYSQATQITQVNSLYGKYRPISMGIRGAFVGATSSDQGVIVVGQANGSLLASTMNGATVTSMSALLSSYKIFPLREGFEIVWTPEDSPDVSQFNPTVSTVYPVNTGFSAPYLVAYVFGAASTAGCLNVELIANFEGQYESQTFMSGGINVAQKPAESGWYESAKNFILGVEKIVPHVRSAAAIYNGVRSLPSVPNLGTLANGFLSAGMLGHSGLPRVPRLQYY